jgi:hypothetical protein
MIVAGALYYLNSHGHTQLDRATAVDGVDMKKIVAAPLISVYELTVDSNKYILVYSADGVAITKK